MSGILKQKIPTMEDIKKRREEMEKTDYEGDKPKPVIYKDNWKHRSAGMKCCTCMWFVPKTDETIMKAIGRCRKHAPTMDGFPAVYTTDWCGDHKIDEGKQ